MKRRRLQFAGFDEVRADIDRLQQDGYDRVGNWDLAQVCDHLAMAMLGSTQDFPFRAPWLFRRFLGPYFFRKIRKAGRMRTGVVIPDEVKPKPGGDAGTNIERFADAVRVFERHPGPFAEHPFLGKFSGKDWRDFHLIHSAHHLGFLVPRVKAS